MEQPPVIQVNNLTKIYKLYNNPVDRLKEAIHPLRKVYHTEFYAVRNLNLTIGQGEVVGIIGKNGSGKSTLLKMLTGVLTPTSGQIKVDGKISALLELGAGFNPELTGLENIYFYGTITGYTKHEMDGKVADILDFADIGDFIHQPIKTYSSGMFVRLAFAVAVAIEPEILIIDEALAVGDIAFQTKCYRKFNEFREAGKTILFVTHDMNTVLKYCNRAIVLDRGHIIAHGSTKEMVDVYKKLLVNHEEQARSANQNNNSVSVPTEAWKQQFTTNSNLLEYGTKEAEIVDYGIFDESGNALTNIINNEIAVIKMRVIFNKTLSDTIFALSIKDVKGSELAGTNTMYENIDTGTYKAGDSVTITFTQPINLQKGNYTISFGCTAFTGDELTVYHRLYDVLIFQVTALKTFVGVFDLQSKIELSKVKNNLQS